MNEYERYAKFRDKKGLTDGKVAKLAGFGRSTFSDWKSKRSIPKYEKMQKIAKVLDISYFELAGIEIHELDPKFLQPQRVFSIVPAWAHELIHLYANATPEAQKSVMILLKNSQKDSDSSKEA